MAKSGSRKAPGAARRVLIKRAKAKSVEVRNVAAPDVHKAAPTATEPEPSDEDVRVRAYFRYLERGGSHGESMDDWAEAKKDLQSARRPGHK